MSVYTLYVRRVDAVDVTPSTVAVVPFERESDAQSHMLTLRERGDTEATLWHDGQPIAALLARDDSQPFGLRCLWVAACDEPATVPVAHPILGDVPTCERHASWARRNDA